MCLDERLFDFGTLIFNGCFPSRRRDLLAGELIKARLLKASGRFDEALAAINSTLSKQPDYPEALLLKAQILWQGFSDARAASACLKTVVQMESMQDENIRRWSQTLLEEIERR